MSRRLHLLCDAAAAKKEEEEGVRCCCCGCSVYLSKAHLVWDESDSLAHTRSLLVCLSLWGLPRPPCRCSCTLPTAGCVVAQRRACRAPRAKGMKKTRRSRTRTSYAHRRRRLCCGARITRTRTHTRARGQREKSQALAWLRGAFCFDLLFLLLTCGRR